MIKVYRWLLALWLFAYFTSGDLVPPAIRFLTMLPVPGPLSFLISLALSTVVMTIIFGLFLIVGLFVSIVERRAIRTYAVTLMTMVLFLYLHVNEHLWVLLMEHHIVTAQNYSQTVPGECLNTLKSSKGPICVVYERSPVYQVGECYTMAGYGAYGVSADEMRSLYFNAPEAADLHWLVKPLTSRGGFASFACGG